MRPSDVSLVIPVRDNATGVRRFLRRMDEVRVRPAEVVLVDSASRPPLSGQLGSTTAKLIRLDEPGAARARNAGWSAARCPWILFCDSDCVPTESVLAGYQVADGGAIAYAGSTRSLGTGMLAAYYDTQRILSAPVGADGTPAYLVTANCLVARAALQEVGGFDESFPGAAGEDIDLSYRLQRIGQLAFAPRSVVLHDFSDGPLGFIRRFARYGRGNWLLEERYGWSHKPTPFAPVENGRANRLLAATQFIAMRAGYDLARLSIW
jgi:glycosyltransferase involved in cell wall biosynthesis